MKKKALQCWGRGRERSTLFTLSGRVNSDRSHSGLHAAFSYVSRGSLWRWLSPTLLVLDDLDSPDEYCSVFCRMLLQRHLSDVFLMIRLVLQVSQRKMTEVKCLFTTSYPWDPHMVNTPTTADADLNLLRRQWSDFSTVQSSFLVSFLFFGKKSPRLAHIQGVGVLCHLLEDGAST